MTKSKMSKEEIAARKKENHEKFLQRIKDNLLQLYKDNNNLEESSFSLWLKAYSLATTNKYTLFKDEVYNSMKTAIINDKIKDLPDSDQVFIRRNYVKVASINILDPRSTNMRQTIHQISNSSTKELIIQQYPSAKNQPVTSVPFKIVVPYSKIGKIIEKVHKSTAVENAQKEVHVGSRKAFRLIYEYFEGIPRMVVEEYVNRCAVCQTDNIVTEKKLRTQRFLQVPGEREMFERLVIDLVTMKDYDDDLQQEIKRYILQIVDHKSKFRFAYVIPKKEAEYVIPQLHELFGIIGPPRAIQSDCGKEFINKRMVELAALWGCDFINSSPRHPQTNGTVERSNGVLKEKIRLWKRQNPDDDWARVLPIIVHQLNIIEHATLGISPYYYAFQIRSWKERRLMEGILQSARADVHDDEKNSNNSDGDIDEPETGAVPKEDDYLDARVEEEPFTTWDLFSSNDANNYEAKQRAADGISRTEYDGAYVNDISEVETATTIPPEQMTRFAQNAEDANQVTEQVAPITTSGIARGKGSLTNTMPRVQTSEAFDAESSNSSTGFQLSQLRQQADITYRKKTAIMEKAYNKKVVPKVYSIGQVVGVVIPARLVKHYATASKKGNFVARICGFVTMPNSTLTKYKVRTEKHVIKEPMDAHQLVCLKGGAESFPKETSWLVDEETIQKLREITIKDFIITCDAKATTKIIQEGILSVLPVGETDAKVSCNTCKLQVLINNTVICSFCAQFIHADIVACAEGKHIVIKKLKNNKEKRYCDVYCAGNDNYFPRINEAPEIDLTVNSKLDEIDTNVVDENLEESEAEVMPIPKKRRIAKIKQNTSSNPIRNIHRNYYYEIPLDYHNTTNEFVINYIAQEDITIETRWNDTKLARLEQAALSYVPPITDNVMNLKAKIIKYLKSIPREKEDEINAPALGTNTRQISSSRTTCCVCNMELNAQNPHNCHICKRLMHGDVICPRRELIKRDSDDKLHCDKCVNNPYSRSY